MALSFTHDDLDRAHTEWACSCGPASLAAICHLTLDEVREHFPGFRGWTNPTMMFVALRRTGCGWRGVRRRSPETLTWPRYGLARIQWEGPWLAPGVPPRVAYRYTHWVGACWTAADAGQETQVFDINVVGEGATRENGDGWLPLAWWQDTIVPALMPKRATGGWHITHAIEVQP